MEGRRDLPIGDNHAVSIWQEATFGAVVQGNARVGEQEPISRRTSGLAAHEGRDECGSRERGTIRYVQ